MNKTYYAKIISSITYFIIISSILITFLILGFYYCFNEYFFINLPIILVCLLGFVELGAPFFGFIKFSNNQVIVSGDFDP